MVTCRIFRLVTTLAILSSIINHPSCQDVENPVVTDLPSPQTESTKEVLKEEQNEGISNIEDVNEPAEEEGEYENNGYDEFLEESYDEFEEVESKERKYAQALLIGAGSFLLLGIAAVIYKLKKDKRKKCPSSWSEDWQDQRKNKRKCKTVNQPDSCVVNFMKPSPDLSDGSSFYQQMPLPLVYEDKGKICNNAEMFIQRCMTSSVKRTYSEPVKNIISSRTKIRDYIKELAYLKEKESKEFNKHSTLKDFFKDLLKMFVKSKAQDKRKRRRPSSSFIKTKHKIEYKSPRNDKKKIGGNLKSLKRESSSSSISITSLLLNSKYQPKYYKKEPHEAIRDYKTRVKKPTKERSNTKRNEKEDKKQHQRNENCCNVRNLNSNVDLDNISHFETEELIKICVNTLSQPSNQKLLALFDPENYDCFSEMQEVAGIMAKEMAVQEFRKGEVVRKSINPQQDSLGPGTSRNVNSLGTTNDTNEALDILKKQFLLFTNQNNFQTNEGNYPLNSIARVQPEATKEQMIRKYLELQSEVEKFNTILKEFAINFVYSENEKSK